MMEAGRELDALVAEKVMGLEVEWNTETPCPVCHLEMRYCGDRSRCTQCGEWRYGPYKEYSTNIAAAWPVHQHICKDGGSPVAIRHRYLHALEPVINDRLRREGKLNRGLAVPWPWLLVVLTPVDICLAALKAKGVR